MTWDRFWLAVALLAIVGLSLALLRSEHIIGAPAAVCHSVTEDSTITDCDYRDGGWYQR